MTVEEVTELYINQGKNMLETALEKHRSAGRC